MENITLNECVKNATEASYSVSNARPIPNLSWDGKMPSKGQPMGLVKSLWLSSFGSVHFRLDNHLSDDKAHGRLYYEDAHGNIRFLWLLLETDSPLTKASERMAYHILQDALNEGIAALTVFLFPTDHHVWVEYPLVEADQGLATKFINLKNKGISL